MAKEKDKESSGAAESEVLSAIQAFEQILEAMPNDRASLEALSHAYSQIGDEVKAKEYTVRLAQVLLDEGDDAAALELQGQIKGYAADDPDAAALVERLEKLAPGGGASAPAEADTPAPAAAPEAAATPAGSAGPNLTVASASAFNMADELSFAWNLMEAGELTQEEYASVVQDLTEMSAGETDATVSVLHALEARAFKGLERVMGFLAKECGTPIVSLSNFELQPISCTILPMDFMVRRGVLIFEILGSDALVVIMNPYDEKLKKDVSAVCGRNCHFFVSMPSEFDQALEKMSEMLLEGVGQEQAPE